MNSPKKILEELGNSFWESRQPDGYSERKDDWVSTEHFDRRIKVASRIYSFQPERHGEEIADLLDFSDNTKLKDIFIGKSYFILICQ